MIRRYLVFNIILAGSFSLGCGISNSEQKRSQKEAIERAEGRRAYVQQNDIEFQNYDKRQRIADDPTTILWCTSAFPIPSSPLFTVPVVGKLTSGTKRPYPTEINKNASNSEYYPELPGPDGIYGSSGDYRYGFNPIGMYADWTNMSLFCTQEPTVWQREKTDIVMQNDPALVAASNAARTALRLGNAAEAQRILEQAVASVR